MNIKQILSEIADDDGAVVIIWKEDALLCHSNMNNDDIIMALTEILKNMQNNTYNPKNVN
jgi:hypothetical protein